MRARYVLRHHALGVCALTLCMVVHAFTISQGSWQFDVPERLFGGYYDALGESLCHGRFDVPPEAIGPEGFVLGGRSYGYFGPAPALPRIALNALWPHKRGRWTRSLMLTDAFLTLLATYLIAHEARRATRALTFELPPSLRWQGSIALFLACVSLGSSLLFITHAVVIYHEASITAVMLAMWASLFVLVYQRNGRAWRLIAACVCAVLSFQARSSVGAGPMVTVALLALAMAAELVRTLLRARRPTSEAVKAPAQFCAYVPALPLQSLAAHTALVAGLMGLLSGAVLYKNHKVYGSLTGVPSLQYHLQAGRDPERLARTGGTLLQPRNFRSNFYNYFDPYNFNLKPAFPFFTALSEAEITLSPEARMDNVEPVASVTGVNTFFSLIALLGALFSLRPPGEYSPGLRRFRIVLAGAAAGGVTILLLGALSLRYQHDFFPFLVIAGLSGLQGLAVSYQRSAWARCTLGVLAVAAVYTCLANTAVSLSMPRW